MNDPVTQSPEGLADQVAALQRQVFVLLLVLLVVSASLAAYLFYQSHIFHKDAANIRPSASQMMKVFSAERPGAELFVNQVRLFGGTHPEFAQQVLAKYGIPPIPPTNGPAPKTIPVKK